MSGPGFAIAPHRHRKRSSASYRNALFRIAVMTGVFLAFLSIFPIAARASVPMPKAPGIPANRPAPAPPGFVSFCIRFASQCATDLSAPVRVVLTPALWRELEDVNDTVNRAILPQDDLSHYGRWEYWTIPTDGRGDCEDYALTKRAELAGMGVSSRALRIAIVIMHRGERHVVLTVVTDRGDYVLDNMEHMVRNREATGYRWVEEQNPDNLWAWDFADPDENPALVAQSKSADPRS